MKKYIYLLPYISIIFPSNVLGGLFGGPSNFYECIVERMKGQKKFMYQTVKKSCEREFESKYIIRI